MEALVFGERCFKLSCECIVLESQCPLTLGEYAFYYAHLAFRFVAQPRDVLGKLLVGL